MPKQERPLHGTEQPSRYLAGIDLGTTNSAVSYVDTLEEAWRVRTFATPQLVDAGQVEARETLPSCHYQPTVGELPAGALCLPWTRSEPVSAVGFFARDYGARRPGRLITSAKSWLCHSGVDRTAELLPWHGAADAERLSPVEVSARYLRHIRDAWDHHFRQDPLSQQDLVVTLPASFDEVARELTVQAAAAAGLPRVVLIEEPQAAFYAWIDAHEADWEQRVSPGQKILVCDIGGGTTDFTLIRVRGGEDGKVQFHRVAVGEHLILGGDNMDGALAKYIERQWPHPLQPQQWDILVRLCQRLKEDLLSPGGGEQLTVMLPGLGAKLIGSGLRVEVDREAARAALLDGFFPFVGLDDKPQKQQSGFREFGLPYAPDPAATRYLAAFLTAHRYAGDERAGQGGAGECGDSSALFPDRADRAAANHDAVSAHAWRSSPQPATTDAGPGRAGGKDPARPDIVLFNGGVFASPLIRQRLLDVLSSWFRDSDPGWSPIVLDNERLDLAVARGAAYYGAVRRGRGVRITAGLARTYYIGVEGEPPRAVCLVPGNAEPGQEIALTQRRFDLLVHQPVEFPLYVSSLRLADQPGELLPIDREQMTSLPPIRTALKTRGKKQAGSLSVQLHARLTEIGTLELWCSEIGSDRSWRLQFDVRSATQTDIAAQETGGEAEGFIEEAVWQACGGLLQATFQADGGDSPGGLVKRLVAALGMERDEWPMSLLRRIWEALMDVEAGRRATAEHEARWLNLLGFALRPGYGLAVDDWRVSETWRTVQGRLAHNAVGTRLESWILWRRIAGGLSTGQQRALADPLLAAVRGLYRRTTTGKGGGDLGLSTQQSAEMWRLLGSLELLDAAVKIETGDMLVEMMNKRFLQPARGAVVWAIGRMGARTPVYGPLNTVVSADVAARGLEELMGVREATEIDKLAVMQLARRADDRYRDVPSRLRDEVLAWLEGHEAPPHFLQLVRDGGQLDQEEQGRVFGESLPKGLRIL